MGVLTVELVAVHAVMAGCKPEYMPVILAILEAMKEETFYWRSSATTTSPSWPVAIVNGPIVREIGLGYSTGAGGRGFPANIGMGLTLSSIVDMVGGSKYPHPNMSQVGNPAEIIAVVMGENEDALPTGWEPLHVELGYRKMDNVVTVKGMFGFSMLGGNGQTGEGYEKTMGESLLRSYAHYLTHTKDCCRHEEVFILLCPQPAKILADEGWTKKSIRGFLWEHARAPVSSWPKAFGRRYCKDLPIEALAPAFDKPERLVIIVTGGPGTHAFYYIGTHGAMVSKRIRE